MKKSLTLLILLASTFVARAQVVDMPAAQPRFSVLSIKKVQTELKLTEDQIKKVSAALDSIVQDDGQGHRMITLTGDMNLESIDKSVMNILNPAQTKRFGEIYMQVAGYAALSLKDYAKKLEITEEQNSKLKAAWEHNRSRFQDVIETNSGGGGIVVSKADTDKLKKLLNDEVESILTKAQIEKWKSLCGDRFELEKDVFDA